MTARRIKWIKFRECGKLLHGRKPLLKMKERIYQSCVRLTMMYESYTWCLKQKMVILRKAVNVIQKATSEVQLKKRVPRNLWIIWVWEKI